MELAQALAAANAVLNASSALLLCLGYRAIKAGRRGRHRRLMLAAFSCSALFLISYLTRVSLAGVHRFPGAGWTRMSYLAVLSSHTVLAVAALPLALRTLQLSLFAGRFEAHKRLARWTLPIWLYVSASGVAVYLMLYQLAPRLR